MPFITLNNSWSNLAQYYNNINNNGSFAGTATNPNVTNTQKPTIPTDGDQFKISDEGLIRGGILNTTLAIRQDLSRLGKFITKGTDNNTKGVLFLLKQAGLQLSNPRLEWNDNPSTSPPLLGGFNRQFTGVGLALSVAGTALGLHFDQPGLLGFVRDNQKYGGDIDRPLGGVAYTNNFNSSNNSINKDSKNRLLRYTSKIINDNSSKDNRVKLDGPYLGGANSVYGIGFTNTFSYFDRTTIRTDDKINLSVRLNGFDPFTNKEISNIANPSNKSSTSIPFIPLPSTGSAQYQYKAYNPPGYTLESRYGVSTNSGLNHQLDAINTINIVGSEVFYGADKDKQAQSYVNHKKVQDEYGEDLIKFRIEFLNNEKLLTGNNTVNTDILTFRAYLDDFSDGMNAKWSSYRYMGRGEEFFVYDGFTRDIGVSFTIHAHNDAEMAPLYSKLNYLMSAMTPDYSSQLKMRGNIGYLTVGDYLFRQPGVFTDIKLSGMLEGSWETGLNNNGESNGQYQVPRMIKVGLSFKPIHTFLPRRNYSSKNASGTVGQIFPAPFITPDKVAYPTLNEKPNTTNAYLNTGDWGSQSKLLENIDNLNQNIRNLNLRPGTSVPNINKINV
jgi:hypothetical protein